VWQAKSNARWHQGYRASIAVVAGDVARNYIPIVVTGSTVLSEGRQLCIKQ